MCAAILTLEAVVLGLTTPVLITVADVSTGTALGIGLGLVAACIIAAGMLGSTLGYALGWVIQGAAIALGVLVPMMYFLGTIFAVLWGAADFLGRKIERERAAAYADYDGGASPG